MIADIDAALASASARIWAVNTDSLGDYVAVIRRRDGDGRWMVERNSAHIMRRLAQIYDVLFLGAWDSDRSDAIRMAWEANATPAQRACPNRGGVAKTVIQSYGPASGGAFDLTVPQCVVCNTTYTALVSHYWVHP